MARTKVARSRASEKTAPSSTLRSIKAAAAVEPEEAPAEKAPRLYCGIPFQGMSLETSHVVADHLAIACDELGEALAAVRSLQPDLAHGIERGLLTVWRLRWELGFVGGKVVADASEVEL